MFEVTFLDHLRLTFAHIVAAHRSHADTARVEARRSRLLKGGEAALIAATAIAATGAAAGWGFGGTVAAAVFAGSALVILLLDLILNLDRSAQAHFQSAVRFWGMRERYRALMADLHDGAIGPEAARAQRNALLDELQHVQEAAPVGSVAAMEEPEDAAAVSAGAMLAAGAGH